MKLGDFIIESGLDVAAFAALLACDASDVREWVRGSSRPDWATIDEIARVTRFHVTADDFMSYPPPKPGLFEFQDSFTADSQSLLLDTRAQDLLAVIRQRKADAWQRRYRPSVEDWNTHSARHGVPTGRSRTATSRFDVHRHGDDNALVVDVQGQHLSDLHSRIVVPLLPAREAPAALGIINPVISLSGTNYVFASHLVRAVPKASLSDPVASVSEDRQVMLTALKCAVIELWP